MWLVYTTDNHHSFRSRKVIAVCDCKERAITNIIHKTRFMDSKIDDDQLFNLNEHNQTRGFDKEIEFVIEQVKLNSLL